MEPNDRYNPYPGPLETTPMNPVRDANYASFEQHWQSHHGSPVFVDRGWVQSGPAATDRLLKVAGMKKIGGGYVG